MTYGPEQCRVRVRPINDHAMAYRLAATARSGLPVAAHLTLLPQLGKPLVPAGNPVDLGSAARGSHRRRSGRLRHLRRVPTPSSLHSHAPLAPLSAQSLYQERPCRPERGPHRDRDSFSTTNIRSTRSWWKLCRSFPPNRSRGRLCFSITPGRRYATFCHPGAAKDLVSRRGTEILRCVRMTFAWTAFAKITCQPPQPNWSHPHVCSGRCHARGNRLQYLAGRIVRGRHPRRSGDADRSLPGAFQRLAGKPGGREIGKTAWPPSASPSGSSRLSTRPTARDGAASTSANGCTPRP